MVTSVTKAFTWAQPMVNAVIAVGDRVSGDRPIWTASRGVTDRDHRVAAAQGAVLHCEV